MQISRVVANHIHSILFWCIIILNYLVWQQNKQFPSLVPSRTKGFKPLRLTLTASLGTPLQQFNNAAWQQLNAFRHGQDNLQTGHNKMGKKGI